MLYILSHDADLDLEEIYDHTRAKFGDDQAAQYLLDLESIFEALSKTLEMGRARDEIKPGLRSFPKISHVIFYRLMKDHVRIIRVMHASRDLPRLLE